ncbi:hypothetical protein Csp1_24760 [Corynebacterium provencense]|uniref:Uncharacterized protein n=1 Tax=Corynebacterium provencense TaxID=1737425 RepID=A0A2Z3YXF5_9CORY|nr:YhjD/YihY/BrkB family envelope integrity protein [Corynebacterium provencense]AWT27224.1 hypothetical protein Csp1_24760 [Corynebacterium provencense]
MLALFPGFITLVSILGLVVGLVTTLWTASGYIKAFCRTMNAAYGVREKRGRLRWNVQMYVLSGLFLLLFAIGLVGALLSGPVAVAVS